MTEILSRRLRGISAVTTTPFSDDGAHVDIDGVHAHVEALIADDLELLVPCGNTGEFHQLTAAEARGVVQATVTAAAGRASVVVGVGGAPQEAAAAARHAADCGADAVMVHQPANPFVTGEGIIAYLHAVAAASDLPLVPYVRRPALSDDDFLRVADELPVPAVKYAIPDPPAVARLAARVDVGWICGSAETWAPFFHAAGAEGFTSGLVNITSRPSRALLDALRAGDRAAALEHWASIRPFEALRARRADGYNVAVVKEALRQLGRPAGPVRPPASAVGPAEREEIAALLAGWGVAEPVAHTR